MNHDTIRSSDAMSGHAPTGARRRRRISTAAWLGTMGLCAACAAIVPLSHAASATAAGPAEGMVCDNGTSDGAGARSFSITARDGYTSEPDGNAIYDWGYAGESGDFQLPGPVLCVNQGEVVTVHLVNRLQVNTSIQFPGQEGVTAGGAPVSPVTDAGGNLVSLVQEAPHDGGSIDYIFTAGAAGTYLYESGSDPQLQVQMGLFGALVVRPTGVTIEAQDILDIPFAGGGTNGSHSAADNTTTAEAQKLIDHEQVACAYASATNSAKCDPLAIYNKDRENILMLSEVDPGLHSFMEQHLAPRAANPTTAPVANSEQTWNAYPGGYEAHYFMINGRSMPDTIAPNFAPWMPSQPYGSMAHVQPWDAHVNPLDTLLRYVAVGVTGYDFHPHSNHEHVIAQDGSLMKGATSGNDNTEEKFNIMVSPGATVDATFRWTNEEGYSDTDGKRLPVTWPTNLNLTEGDFWSGSPYLGESAQLNPGILGKTQCGEYYHVAHSHDLTQATNYGITFGGMLTLIKVEPPANVQGTTVGNVHVPVCKG
jgi:hypothetical protein